MGQSKRYTGSCHCGKVRYHVEAALSGKMITCNCSICGRTGTMLTFVPADKFSLEKGEDVLTDYQFAKKNIHHLFCSICGVRSFARGVGPDGKPVAAINVRCLEGVDLKSLNTMEYDGKSL